LAEFDFDGNPLETFPINQGVERRTMYHMKKDMMPQLYWHLMMKYVKLLDFFLAQRDS
jgi:sulfide:quinone oxidoreductase